MTTLTKPINLLLISFILFAISCGSPQKKAVNQISDLENVLKEQAARPEKAKLDELLTLYTNYVDQFPKDSAAPIYLYNAINLSMGMNDGQTAMKLIDRSMNEYPNGPRIAETIFLKAYVYENQLNNYGKASSIYRDFIHRFPKHELADDAQTAIENMGKTPDELVREFEAKAAAQKTTPVN